MYSLHAYQLYCYNLLLLLPDFQQHSQCKTLYTHVVVVSDCCIATFPARNQSGIFGKSLP